jgi:uncharacterized membrane protein YphA (DoxX/SURF4 family)
MKSLILLRLAVAITWFYEGLYLKLLVRDASQLKVIAATTGSGQGATVLTLIGVGQTLLGLCVLIGLWTRPLAIVQIVAIIALYAAAIAQGAIGNPASVIVANLPLLACLGMLAAHGPGRWNV